MSGSQRGQGTIVLAASGGVGMHEYCVEGVQPYGSFLLNFKLFSTMCPNLLLSS